jgi:hypothetical protein
MHLPDWSSWFDSIPFWVLVAGLTVLTLVALFTVWGAAKLMIKLVRTKRHLGELGTGGKIAFWGSILYTIFPIDLLPDPIYLDDMAVLGGALLYLLRLWRKRHGNLPVPTGRHVPGPTAGGRPTIVHRTEHR